MSDQIQDRKAKRDRLRALGIDPYGQRFVGVTSNAEIAAAAGRFTIEAGQVLEADARASDGSGPTFRAAGRVVLYRDIGSLIFLTVRDWTGQLQFGLSKKMILQGSAGVPPTSGGTGVPPVPGGAGILPAMPGPGTAVSGEAAWQLAKLLDLGDIIGADGRLGRTKTGELTLWVTHLHMLSKAVRPPPEKWHGLTDVEARYRRRYVDLASNPEAQRVFVLRARIIDYARDVLKQRGFIEVDTPVLQPIYGGAAARPFTTHHNALDMKLYLRISPELYLKRCLVGGLERVFEFSRCFRNEGVSPRHNPEFTMLELYQAYGDYHDMMDLCEAIIGGAARDVIGSHRIPVPGAGRHRSDAVVPPVEAGAGVPPPSGGAGTPPADSQAAVPLGEHRRPAGFSDARAATADEPGHDQEGAARSIDFTPPWPRRKYADLFREHAGIAIHDIAAIRARAGELFARKHITLDPAKADDPIVVNALFEHYVEPHLINPTFVVDYPAPICPLTKRDPSDPRFALRFELYINCMEMGNAYSELNDPDVQAETFSAQLRGEGDETMAVMDRDYVEALEYGLPPAGGLGIGIDRLVMLLTSSASIRDVLLFPLQRPERA